MFETWANAFGIPKEEKDTILYLVADFIKLVQETKNSISKLENRNTTIYLKPFVQIDNALQTLNLNQTSDVFFRGIEETALYNLEVCSDLISSTYNEKTITKKDLTDLLEDVDPLIEKVLNSALPPDIKANLMDILEHFRFAILSYRINGSSGIKKAVERGLGGYFIALSENEKAMKSAEKESGLKKFLGFLEKAYMHAGGANKIATLTEYVTKSIDPSTPST